MTRKHHILSDNDLAS